jgi:alcohol dehydrogenase
MLGACHACANPLTAHYGLTHGIAIGILLPYVIRYNAEKVGPLYGDLARDAAALNGDPGIAADWLARRITELMKLAELPTKLSTVGVSKGILPVLADEAAQQWTGKFNPRPVGEAELLRLYEEAY